MAFASHTIKTYPICVLLFSGKRKSGKDYITDKIMERISTENAVMIKISAPIKSYWADKHGLCLNELMGTGEYKEKHRQDMVTWSEEVRRKDYGYFCEAAVKMFQAQVKPIWIISDTRRRTDLKWFKEKYGSVVKTIRVTADEEVRKKRGWIFTPGVDDAETECDLDEVTEWDWSIENNGTESELEENIKDILKWIDSIQRS
ncbi:Phosphomevalonate kinase [Blattella germanica]|nr:Phosphomevalonate kinase [Blattella germanica]